MANPENKNKLESFAQITKIASGISVILGIILALWGVYDSLKDAEMAIQSAKLNALDKINQLANDDTTIQKTIEKFLANYDNDAMKDLIALKGGGKSVYYSDEFSDLRKIGRHYERMGALVKLKYLDFDLIFELIPFPDDFWQESSAIRAEIRENFYDTGRGLPDFWSNFEFLHNLYTEERARRKL